MNCECGRPLAVPGEAEAHVVHGRKVCAVCFDQVAGGGNLPVSAGDGGAYPFPPSEPPGCYEVHLNVIEICLLMGMLGLRLQRSAESAHDDRWLPVTGGLVEKLSRAMAARSPAAAEEERRP